VHQKDNKTQSPYQYSNDQNTLVKEQYNHNS
jgi:hypothetical protein